MTNNDDETTGMMLDVEAARTDAENYLKATGGDPALLLAALIRLIADNDTQFSQLRESATPNPALMGEHMVTATNKIVAAAKVFASPLLDEDKQALADAPTLGARATPQRETPTSEDTEDAGELDVDFEFARLTAYTKAEEVADDMEHPEHDFTVVVLRTVERTLAAAQALLSGGTLDTETLTIAVHMFSTSMVHLGTLADVLHDRTHTRNDNEETKNSTEEGGTRE